MRRKRSFDVLSPPWSFVTLEAEGASLEGLHFRIQIDTRDCTGCGSCIDVCPANTKALERKPLASQTAQQVPNFDFASTVSYKDDLLDRHQWHEPARTART